MKYTTLCLKDLMVFIIWKACLMNQRVLGKSKVVQNTISKSNKLISLLLFLIVFLADLVFTMFTFSRTSKSAISSLYNDTTIDKSRIKKFCCEDSNLSVYYQLIQHLTFVIFGLRTHQTKAKDA